MGRALAIALGASTALTATPSVAWSQTAPSAPAGEPTSNALPAEPGPPPPPIAEGIAGVEAAGRPIIDTEKALPPPTNVVYFQYGVSFTAEVVSSPGPICDNVTVPCILGTGGGIAVRAGWRGTGPWYLGGAYEFSKQDPNNLLRLAILQQMRFEARYYLVSGRVTEPYLCGGAGIAGYGNEWTVDTFGPMTSLGIGLEAQITRSTVVGTALNYRLLYFRGFNDTTGAARDAGVAQIIGLDLVLEQRQAIFTQAPDERSQRARPR
ncbi:MAG: hypothetical protein JST00_08645 [Deltaproteobacteria bacterium]|nr:hypothetical protein [Deltaproteobacteria bacterium]